MELKQAVEVFERLEARRYSRADVGQVAYSPIYNVRLDAMTMRKDAERGFRLFVRIDDGVPRTQSTEALSWITGIATEFGLESTVDNGGIELTG